MVGDTRLNVDPFTPALSASNSSKRALGAVHLVENSVTTENGILVASVSAITDGKLNSEERILGNQILTEISDDDYLDRLLV